MRCIRYTCFVILLGWAWHAALAQETTATTRMPTVSSDTIVATCQRGEGPGEYYYEPQSGGNPRGYMPRIVAADASGCIYLFAEGPAKAKILKFGPEGKYIETLKLGSASADVMTIDGAGNIWLAGHFPGPNSGSIRLTVREYSNDGALVRELPSVFDAVSRIDVLEDGTVLVATRRAPDATKVLESRPYAFGRDGMALSTSDKVLPDAVTKALGGRIGEERSRFAAAARRIGSGPRRPEGMLQIGGDGSAYCIVFHEKDGQRGDYDSLSVRKITFKEADSAVKGEEGDGRGEKSARK